MSRLFTLGLLLTFLPGCSGYSGPAPDGNEHVVAVAAAADLRFVFEDLSAAFQRRRPDIHVQVTSGSSGNFFAQTQNGAPFDLFLSADMDYPRKLVDAGLADRESEFVYAVGHLVVWVPKRFAARRGETRARRRCSTRPCARSPSPTRRHAPYGRAAEAALKSLGVYDR